MGTSTKWPAPKGGPWANAASKTTRIINQILDQPDQMQREPSSAGAATRRSATGLSQLGSAGGGSGLAGIDVTFSDETVVQVAEVYREALISQLRDDPERFELRSIVTEHAVRLVGLAAELTEESADYYLSQVDITTQSGRDEIVAMLVNRVCIPGGPLGNAMIRSAVVKTVGRIVDESAERDRAGGGTKMLDEGLFCEVYRWFFADAVTAFLTTLIAAKLSAVLPVLVVVDPAGEVTAHIAAAIAEQIPTPCEEKANSDSPRSVTDIATGMVRDTFDRWLESAMAGPDA